MEHVLLHGGSRVLASFLILLLGLAPPGLNAGPSSTALISVVSEPAGARVLVDGEAHGRSPVEVRVLAPGTHRVVLEKDGYLEKLRLVTLSAGDQRLLLVVLTPVVSPAHSLVQVEPTPPSGGGGSKLKWIIPLVLAGGAGAFFLLRGKNEPPVAGTASVSPSLGIVSVTRLTFSVSGASDPDGDTLTYTWSFGDGGTGTGQTVTHVYSQEGSFNATVTVSDGKASAMASASARTRSMTGSWRTLFGGIFPLDYAITQSGTSWSGNATNGNRFTGTLSDPLTLSMSHVWIGCPNLTRVFPGTIAADLNSFDVTAQNCPGTMFPLRFTRQ